MEVIIDMTDFTRGNSGMDTGRVDRRVGSGRESRVTHPLQNVGRVRSGQILCGSDRVGSKKWHASNSGVTMG